MAKKKGDIPNNGKRTRTPSQKKTLPKKDIRKKGKSKNTQNSKATKKGSLKKTKKNVTHIGGFNRSNFNYIRSLLWQKHREDFKSYFDPSFIQLVREIFNDCKGAGLVCTEEIVLKRFHEIKEDNRRKKPFILPYFFEPRVYYEIKDCPFPTFSPYLYIISDMILPYPHEFRITEYYKKTMNGKIVNLDIFGYEKFFSNWVNWCNAVMREEHGLDVTSERIEIYFRLTDAIYNEQKQRWESLIYTCTPSGAIHDFGYVPEDFDKDKDVSMDLKLPKDKELVKEPISEQEKKRATRLKNKFRKYDTLRAWDSLVDELKKEKQKKVQEDYEKNMAYYDNVQEDIDKEIRKFKRKKDFKKVKELEKMYSKIGDIKIKLIKDFGKTFGAF